ncbi:hypothetical protein IP70_10760 [alpha proteobacterium AAP38]|nr:hypothetical protein IP70_10760 [alpha proteobacterium AAP38]
MAKSKTPPPALAALSGRLAQGSTSLAALNSRFNHSFEVALDRVEPDPAQNRQHFDEGELAALSDSLKQVGQLSPILVRPHPARPDHYILVAGERRWRAARLAGWTSMVALRFDGDADTAALVENLQRVDLTPLEEAKGLERLMRQRGLKQQEVASLVGKSTVQVSSLLKILTLPAPVLSDLGSDAGATVPRGTLFEIARAPAEQQPKLWALARDGKLNVRTARQAKDEGDLPSPAPAATGTAPRLPAIGKWTRSLQAVKGTSLSKQEREELLALKAAIEAVLAGK